MPTGPLTPIRKHISAGNIPKHTTSQSESIWTPYNFSSSVLFFLLLAIFPSNISQRPESARHVTAVLNLPFIACVIPITDIKRLIYVSITV